MPTYGAVIFFQFMSINSILVTTVAIGSEEVFAFLFCSSPTSPLLYRRQSSDFLRYFSPEQIRQLADMFKEVVGDSPQQPQVQSSSLDLSKCLCSSGCLPMD